MGNHFRTWILLGTVSAIFIGLGGMLGKSYMIRRTAAPCPVLGRTWSSSAARDIHRGWRGADP